MKENEKKKSVGVNICLKTTQEHINTSYKTNREEEKKPYLFIYHRYNFANVPISSSIIDG